MNGSRKMGCEETRTHITDWLHNQLDKPAQIAMNEHLAGCLECQEAFAADKQLWDNLGKISVAEPSETMRVNFYNMLDEFKTAEKPAPTFTLHSLLEKLRGFVLPQWSVQLAFSLLLVGLGWAIGHLTSEKNTQAAAYQQQVEELASQVQDMKSSMMLTLLENPSATERLRAVGYTSEIVHADQRVIDALFATLDNDPNVNVRLVTLEALIQYTDNPTVREGLVRSLKAQDSPMVQVALADIMVKLQEKKSVRELKKLLKKDDLNDMVKTKIEQSIRDLS